MANMLAPNGQQKQKQPAPPAQNQQAAPPAKMTESTIDNVLNKVAKYVDEGELHLPANYSAQNAVRSAYLALQELTDRNNKPVLQACTRESVVNALYEMVTQGLSYTKGQCYFIPYGDKLSCDISYLGNIAIAKRDADVKDVHAMCVYEDDEFTYEIDRGQYKVLTHKQLIGNVVPEKLLGAYCIVDFNAGHSKTEIMTMQQIRTAWAQGATKGNSPAHQKFPDQMAMKTVINRALKIDTASTDDRALLVHRQDAFAANVQADIKQNANKSSIGFRQNTEEATDYTVVDPQPAQHPDPKTPADPDPAPQQDLNNNISRQQNPAATQTLGPGF
ncbi:MAG TPA: recombinase RecT [Flavitalea sp.]|nr:recombinase RecT [Flavitalea sp.]